MTHHPYLTFRLRDEFVDPYRDLDVPWGYKDAAGNSVAEIVFLRTYSRKKEDGTKETWVDVCRRVIEGMFSIQKDHCTENRIPWNGNKARATAEDAFDRLFNFKWTPPGRGLWMMGTPMVHVQKNSAALQNCSFVSTADMTKNDPAGPFAFLMEASMLGIGVGFDTKGPEKEFEVYSPREVENDRDMEDAYFTIDDTREGWVESVEVLLDAFLKPGRLYPTFVYDLIRPAGAPIKTFGGTAAGPEPLMHLHEELTRVLEERIGETLTTKDIADIGNLIGVCVVAGNVRRSAELLMGKANDTDFMNLKNSEVFPERNADGTGWGWMSNNSVEVNVGDDLSGVVEGIKRNGEPGVIWMDLSREYGRLGDPADGKDWRAAGYNPCAEQTLESFECCTLVETYLNRHEDYADYQQTLKVAYLYAKTVTLLPTHWERTNAIMLRNRRIGTSASGVANFVDRNGLAVLRSWMDTGYGYIQELDEVYSEWLCVRESIKTTTVKPSGTVSILAGESPGVHWSPGGEFFERRVTFSKDDPIVTRLRWSGYEIEVSRQNPETSVVIAFPIHSLAKRSEKDVTIFEKAHLAALMQRYWSDNSVSVTLSYHPETEAEHIGTILAMYEGQLKTVSFLPMGGGSYPQMPYTDIDEAVYTEAGDRLLPVDLSDVYLGDALDAAGEAFCETDVCEIKEADL